MTVPKNVLKSFSSQFVFLIGIFVAAFPCYGQEQGPVYVDVSQCRNIAEESARFKCYENLTEIDLNAKKYGKVQSAASEDKASKPSPTETTEAQQELARQPQEQINSYEPKRDNRRVEEFGRDSSKIVNGEDGEEILLTTISELKKTPDGWIVTLENGQTWRQVYAKRYLLRKGMQITIAPTSWGSSYRLSSEDLGGYIQVKRLQ